MASTSFDFVCARSQGHSSMPVIDEPSALRGAHQRSRKNKRHFCAASTLRSTPGTRHTAGWGKGDLIGIPQGEGLGMVNDTCLHVARLTLPDIALGQYPRQHVSCRALTFA